MAHVKWLLHTWGMCVCVCVCVQKNPSKNWMNLKPEVRTLVGIHWHGNSRAPRPMCLCSQPKNPGVRTSRGVDRKAETTPATWAAPNCKAKRQSVGFACIWKGTWNTVFPNSHVISSWSAPSHGSADTPCLQGSCSATGGSLWQGKNESRSLLMCFRTWRNSKTSQKLKQWKASETAHSSAMASWCNSETQTWPPLRLDLVHLDSLAMTS